MLKCEVWDEVNEEWETWELPGLPANCTNIGAISLHVNAVAANKLINDYKLDLQAKGGKLRWNQTPAHTVVRDDGGDPAVLTAVLQDKEANKMVVVVNYLDQQPGERA